MKRLVIALAVLGTALGANATLLLRPDAGTEALTGTVEVTLGNRKIIVLRALIRDRAQMAGGRLDRLDLVVDVADFSPLQPPTARDPDRPMPDRVALTLTAGSTATPEMTELFQTVYARFLGRETWSNPGGLLMRRFRPGTPYEDRELYIGAGGKRIFIALCPQESHLPANQRDIEPCTTLIRQDGLDAEVRFHARHLPDWRRIVLNSQTLLDALASSASETVARQSPAK